MNRLGSSGVIQLLPFPSSAAESRARSPPAAVPGGHPDPARFFVFTVVYTFGFEGDVYEADHKFCSFSDLGLNLGSALSSGVGKAVCRSEV